MYIYRVTIPGVNPYRNFDVGVTIVNDAGFESNKTIQTYVASTTSVSFRLSVATLV